MCPHDHQHGPRCIDIHAHWYPADWIRLMEKDGAKFGASIKREGTKYTVHAGHIANAAIVVAGRNARLLGARVATERATCAIATGEGR